MNSNTIKVVVVEDEPLVLEKLVDGLNEDPMLEVCGKAESVNQAFNEIVSKAPDAIFLDINLIGGDGFEVLHRLRKVNYKIPPVVLNTGFERFEYAQTAFNNFKDDIVCLLKKPFFENWEAKRQRCIDEILAKKYSEVPAPASISLRSGMDTFIVPHDQLLFLEVGGSGTVIVVTIDGRQIRVNQTMSALLGKLPDNMLKVSRDNAINTNLIERIDHESHRVFLRDYQRSLKIGDAYYAHLMKLLTMKF